jgi:hypothetical protein
VACSDGGGSGGSGGDEDGGDPWTAPVALNTTASTDSGDPDNDPRDDLDPQITSDAAGNWVAVWSSEKHLIPARLGTDWEILVARSTDDGASWTAPVQLNGSATSESGEDYRPQIATDGAGSWVAVWESEDALGSAIGADVDILVARSADDGATWTVPAALNTNAANDSGDDRNPQITSDAAGNWVAVWESEDPLGGAIGPDTDILVARSTDAGATWTAPAALNTNAAGDSSTDWDPQVATDGAGSWLAVWSSDDPLGGAIGPDADILVARSTNAGATWTAPAALNTNAAGDSGAGDWDPQVTGDGAGNWVSVWESDNSLGGTSGADWDILVARSTDDGASWTAPATLNSNATSDSGDDVEPQVTTDGAGNWVAAWFSHDSLGDTIDADWDILVARSTDDGASWTAPAALNSNATSDLGEDFRPQIAADGAGGWLAVWESDDSLGGTIGVDYDILVARH